MNEHAHPFFQPILNRLLCAEENPEGLDEVMELWREFKQETTVGPCNANGETPELSDAEDGETTTV